MAVDHALEELMSTLGDFGRYQGFQFFLHILSGLTAGMHMLTLVTVAAVPNHRCFIDGVDTNESIALWDSEEILSKIPMIDGKLDSCNMFIDGSNDTTKCTQYVYDDTFYKDSRSIDWNMVCDDRYRGAIAQTIYMLGVFTGAVTLGSLADKIGRKKVFCWSATLQLILGVGVAFVPEYYSFLFVRYLYGIFGSAGSYITGFVLTMELVGPSKRTPCGVAFQAAFAGGIMLVAGWAAIIKDRQMLQVVYGLHGLLLFAHWWLMDESPRWLWTQGRHAEAVDIVAKAAKKNRNNNGVDKQYYLSFTKTARTIGSSEPQKSSFGISDLFKSPNLRMTTLNVCLCWFANSIAYYGLSLSTGKLGGNPFFNLFIMSLVEIPSYVAVILLLDRLGRRSITSSFMIVGGIACVMAVFLAQESTESTTVVFIGKLFIAGSFAVIYNYSAELFPTVVRNSAMGLGSMCARLAGAFTPLITLLDSFDPKIPAIIFGAVSLVSGIWVMFLPETNGQSLPESIEDGENFGKGDTCFTTGCLGRKPIKDEYSIPPEQQMVQELETINR